MISFKNHSGIHTLNASQELPISIDHAWDFFSSPGNLVKITPEQMGFRITSEVAETMYSGQIITYKVGIFPGISTNWVTEITQVDQPNFFIDEQREGPYAMWHHEHRFLSVPGGVLMSDKVTYKVPLGILGNFMNKIYIQNELRKVFQYREKVLNKLFPSEQAAPQTT